MCEKQIKNASPIGREKMIFPKIKPRELWEIIKPFVASDMYEIYRTFPLYTQSTENTINLTRKFCRYCGKENLPEMRICDGCGAIL